MATKNNRGLIYCLLWCCFVIVACDMVHTARVQSEPSRNIAQCPVPIKTQDARIVRIALAIGERQPKVSFTDFVDVYVGRGSKSIAVLPGDGTYDIRTLFKGVLIGSHPFWADIIRLHPRDGQFIVNDVAYFGDLLVWRNADLTVTLVNYLPIEEYLKGVLPKEAWASWPMEVLKAQAIASRTYALFEEGSSADEPYSMTTNVLSQVYGGLQSQNERTNEAVLATAGKIMTHRDKLFPAFFHATCGGSLEDAHEVWFMEAHPSLVAKPCLYCLASPNYSWEVEITAEDIKKALVDNRLACSIVTDCHIEEYDRSGRARAFLVYTPNAVIRVPGNQFRLFIGSQKMKSLRISKIEKDGDTYRFIGNGYGHGVGMCQWGGSAMAKDGRSAEDILSFYYPGTKIKKVY